MRTILFVLGFQEDIKSHDYAATIAAIESRGYDVKFLPIDWLSTMIERWATELDEVYTKYDPNQIIFAGFSHGAMTAFTSAVKRSPSELWLFFIVSLLCRRSKEQE
jgi:predicted esterase